MLAFVLTAQKPVYKKGWSLWLYEGRVKDALYRLKNNNNENYGRIFGKEVVTLYHRDIFAHHIDVIIPVPLHPKKLRTRGYNQAEFIARAIGNELGIPCDTRSLVRTIYTSPQKELSDTQRLVNLKKAFGVVQSEEIYGKRILLCDDIYTTGSTINGCAKALLNHGASEVYFITIAIGKGF